jgi:hypothetical protein
MLLWKADSSCNSRTSNRLENSSGPMPASMIVVVFKLDVGVPKISRHALASGLVGTNREISERMRLSMRRKLTAADRRARRERKRKYMIIFVGGKQKRVPREPTIEGLPVDEFIARNADAIWLHQNELWELMPDADW